MYGDLSVASVICGEVAGLGENFILECCRPSEGEQILMGSFEIWYRRGLICNIPHPTPPWNTREVTLYIQNHGKLPPPPKYAALVIMSIDIDKCHEIVRRLAVGFSEGETEAIIDLLKLVDFWCPTLIAQRSFRFAVSISNEKRECIVAGISRLYRNVFDYSLPIKRIRELLVNGQIHLAELSQAAREIKKPA